MLTRSRTCEAIALGAFLLFLTTSTCAQAVATPATQHGKHDQPYALIFGTVWGPDQHPRYGVKIRIRREGEKKARWELFSDHHGEFAQRVPPGPGDYVIWADLKGYKSAEGARLQQSDEVKVHVDNDERVDTGLHLK